RGHPRPPPPRPRGRPGRPPPPGTAGPGPRPGRPAVLVLVRPGPPGSGPSNRATGSSPRSSTGDTLVPLHRVHEAVQDGHHHPGRRGLALVQDGPPSSSSFVLDPPGRGRRTGPPARPLVPPPGTPSSPSTASTRGRVPRSPTPPGPNRFRGDGSCWCCPWPGPVSRAVLV